uniref:Reverse transcriptase Ty1/copia-type domain-containing protein n=1 Tax=Fagus sylvatica TaxID=28930 RepID=A0A2N9ETD3_FAGSY
MNEAVGYSLRLFWRSFTASTISGLAPPLQSEFRSARCLQKLKQSPKTHCLRRNFHSKLPIETPPPPLERSLDDSLSRTKIVAIQHRTRPHSLLKGSARRHALSRAWLQSLPRDQLDLADPPWDTPNDAMKYATRHDQMCLYQFLMALHDDYEPVRGRKKQSVVTRSNTEAEYRALADTTSELLWLRWLLQDLSVSTSSATPIYCDNWNAIQIARNDIFHKRTKHIEIDYHLVRHHLLQSSLQLIYVSSHDQLADIFTKSHPTGRFRDLVSKLQLVSHPPP